MQQQAEMMARFHEQTPSAVLHTEKSPFLVTSDGRAIGLFPLDYIPWTKRLADYIPALTAEVDASGKADAKEMWFEGVISPETRKAMEQHGWTVKDKVQLLLPPS